MFQFGRSNCSLVSPCWQEVPTFTTLYRVCYDTITYCLKRRVQAAKVPRKREYGTGPDLWANAKVRHWDSKEREREGEKGKTRGGVTELRNGTETDLFPQVSGNWNPHEMNGFEEGATFKSIVHYVLKNMKITEARAGYLVMEVLKVGVALGRIKKTPRGTYILVKKHRSVPYRVKDFDLKRFNAFYVAPEEARFSGLPPLKSRKDLWKDTNSSEKLHENRNEEQVSLPYAQDNFSSLEAVQQMFLLNRPILKSLRIKSYSQHSFHRDMASTFLLDTLCFWKPSHGVY
ncbi:hypothetical protein WN51_09358 [Melipona quadrifasciata]|uniref:Uncharacterized protein n=1 Tax=Melipona quadrifasciata TaxID=166423 RepID=A0A0M9A7U9_9HYME|nr:hypothetical protein WN51_09358 [Melipona quadrifasciata]